MRLTRPSQHRLAPRLLATPLVLALCGCPPVAELSLGQAVFDGDSQAYRFDSTDDLRIEDSPPDADWGTWAMLHDGEHFRLYAMRQGGGLLYQFAYDDDSGSFVFGEDSIDELPISGAPGDVDWGQVAMSHDGGAHRLYLRDLDDPRSLHQFAFDDSADEYVYGFDSIAVLPMTGAPAGALSGPLAMLHDGSHYRAYEFAGSGGDALAQYAYDDAAQQYVYGLDSISEIPIEDTPPGADASSFSMLHDGDDYRLYMLLD